MDGRVNGSFKVPRALYYMHVMINGQADHVRHH